MSGVLCPQGGNLPILTGSATVTVGQYVIPATNPITYWGLSFSQGSVTPTLWGSSGITFRLLCWVTTAGLPTADVVFFNVNGYAPNEGWTTHTIGGTTFNRVDAAYSYAADGNYTTWYWSTSSNPYGTTVGATKAVSWS